MAGRRALGRRAREGGVSLAEMIVVIAIAVVLIAVAVPKDPGSSLAATEARRMIADGLRTRSVARTRWKPTKVEFDIAGGRYRCATTDEEPILSPDSDPDGWRTLGQGVSLQATPGKDPVLIFLPNGRALQDGGITVFSGSKGWEISANALGGAITSDQVEL